jgi:hypothetical protein
MSCTHNLKPNPQIPTTSITLKKQAKELHKCKLHNAYKNIEAWPNCNFKKKFSKQVDTIRSML